MLVWFEHAGGFMKITKAKLSVKVVNTVPQEPVNEMAYENAVHRIEKLNTQLAKFWSSSDGWAPVSAAGLLGKSRLDWQVSLSATLHKWESLDSESMTSGELILAWTNLGSLTEGTIKLLLSIYYETFISDIENLKKSNAFNHNKQEAKSPDGLGLEQLRTYCTKRELLDEDELVLVALIQQRRNAIHAFKDRSIGDEQEFQQAVRSYLQLLRNIVARLPYPDDVYIPLE